MIGYYLRLAVRSIDATPTALWLLGLPVGEDLPGRPVTEALAPAARDKRPVRTIRSDIDRGYYTEQDARSAFGDNA